LIDRNLLCSTFCASLIWLSWPRLRIMTCGNWGRIWDFGGRMLWTTWQAGMSKWVLLPFLRTMSRISLETVAGSRSQIIFVAETVIKM
jgi:hypothetical protein